MLSGHRSAWRRRSSKSRAARIAVPLAIPMALGLTLGIILAISGGNNTNIAQSALGASASPSGSASAAAAAPAAAAATPTTTAAAANAANTAIPPANRAGRPGVAGANAADAAGNAFNFNQDAAMALASMNCTLAVPANPLTAQGLATPWQLGDGCTWANGATEGAFVEATILSPNGQLQIYDPLVITQGTLPVPPAGTGKDGQACQTTRDFGLIDQDQSDNVVGSYLFNANTGQTAQNTAANAAAIAGATPQGNGSDNGLLNKFVDVALGCTPFTATNTTSPNGTSGSQALDELSARQNQQGTIALLPVNNPQLLVGGNFSVGKTNTYRIETDQRPLARTNTSQNAAMYCQNMVNIQTPRLMLDANMETGTASPVPALGNNLANFLAARLSGSFGNLHCQNFGLTNPVTLTVDGNGVATAATFNTAQQTAKVTGTTRGAGAGQGGGGARNRGNFMPGRHGHM